MHAIWGKVPGLARAVNHRGFLVFLQGHKAERVCAWACPYEGVCGCVGVRVCAVSVSALSTRDWKAKLTPYVCLKCTGCIESPDSRKKRPHKDIFMSL